MSEPDGAPEEPVESPKARDYAQGYVGHIYEDAFRELYAEKQTEKPPPEVDADADPPEDPPEGEVVQRDDGEIDLNKEAEEIKEIQAQLLGEDGRLQELQELLEAQLLEAKGQDQQEAEALLEQWGLVMREQLPIPESKLKKMLDRQQMENERLIVPRGMMEDMERYYEIKKGTIPHHDNLLAISKPEEPNHFKMTRSQKLRGETMQVKSTLTSEQKTVIAQQLAERLRKRPRAPKGLSADQKAKNREIVKKMQMKVNFLKNPRFLADRGGKEKGEPCPFWFTPDVVLFRNYEIGGLYEIQVDFRNSTGISRRLRVLPCKSAAFSIKELRYDKELNSQRPELAGLDPLAAVVAPGMAAHLVVHFAPSTLNDESDCLTVCTEIGDFELPLLSRREQPSLSVADPVDCGCMLAGNNITKIVRIENTGGEGAFRLIVNEDEPPEDYYYETFPGSDLTLVVGSYSISPASFYVEAKSSIDLKVRFDADKVGHHWCPLFVEGDNGERTPLRLVAVCDAIRLELASWPRLPELKPLACEEGVSPWQLIPWRLDWATQVGHKGMQSIEIANGGYMPMQVDWALARPPRQFSARTAVGFCNRLSDRIIHEIHDWALHPVSTYSSPLCPFKVEPTTATIKPFSRQKFHFSFQAHGPVNSHSSVLAYLVARDLPDSRACILHYERLCELQKEMAPESGYTPALPLFGQMVSEAFNRKLKHNGCMDPVELKVADPKDCSVSRVITAVALQGRAVKPSVTVMPKILALPGDVLPFVPSVREIKLQNSGPSACFYRVRLTSTMHAADANSMDPLWIVSVPEVGPRPADVHFEPFGDEAEQMRHKAKQLSRGWPPLPPEAGLPGASQLPGYGALASVAVEPHEGRVPPHGTVTLRVTLRAVHECDLDAQLVIDLPLDEEQPEPAAPPLKVGIAAAFRSPRAEVRSRATLDYGVVRAHARHTLKVELSNPTEMPMLLQLRQFKEKEREHIFPVQSHRDVVNLFLEAMNQQNYDGYAAIQSDAYVEVPVKPWVHSKSGCLDQSGRRKFAAGQRSADEVDESVYFGGVPDEEDFVFSPGYLALWPGQRGEVEVTLRSREVGKYSALLEAVGFNSLHAQCLEVFASVQLPLVRINTHHAHFPITYLRTPSEPFEVELRNESEMSANFKWEVPLKMEACLECQIQPTQGHIPPRGSLTCVIIAVPTNLCEGQACLPCNLFVEEILQPLELRVTAIVYGCEVDYAVVAPGELPPEIRHQPRGPTDPACDPLGSYMISTGRAHRKMPIVDFGQLPLQKAECMHVVLYNRTGIATPFSAKIEKNPAYDPLVKGRKIGDYLDAATRMYALINQSGGAEPGEEMRQSFESSPQPAKTGRDDDGKIKVKKLKSTLNKTKKTSTKKKWILDDKHERQAFRSSIGADFAKQKEMKEHGRMALKAGRGFAVKVNPTSDWLQPFSTTVIQLTCFSDLPGFMEDELVLTLRELPGHAEGEAFRIPLRLQSYGNPLYLPDQQVGLNTLAEPPRLSCGVTVPAEKQLVRRFNVGNHSAARVVVNWKVFPKSQLENMAEERNMITVGLCGRSPEVKDPFVQEAPKDDVEQDVLQLTVEEKAPVVEDEEEPLEEPFNFKIWSEQPPLVEDPFSLPEWLPVVIEPVEAIVPEHSTATFTVTMTCPKATLTAESHYRYTLIGDCRFTKDRQQRLAFAEENPDEDFDDVVRQDVYVEPSQEEQVSLLPDIEIDDEQLVDDDSDVEQTAQERKEQSIEVPAPTVEVKKLKRTRAQAAPPQPLAVEPQLDVLATIVIDCVGDCVLPRLTVDKKGSVDVEEFPAQNKELDDVGALQEPPVVNAPCFKFVWPGEEVSGAQVRQISLANHNASKVSCRFRTQGPYRIQVIQQPGHHAVYGQRKKQKDEVSGRLFVLAKWETITLHVAFQPELVPTSQWHHYLSRCEHVFKGDLVVEYPRETTTSSSTHKDDLQRIHLVGHARRPSVALHLVPNHLDRALRLERAERPPWGEPMPLLVDFGYTHITSSVTRSRTILISNVTNIMAKWSLAHVGRKRKPAPIIGATLPEEEEFRALDDKDAFEFDLSGGELPGPSKDGLVPGSEERLPHWCAKSSAVPRAVREEDERYEPQRLKISFRPKKNELYKCRFRVQVESGLTTDFICRGCGSYDEEDDHLDFHEA